MNHPFAVGRVGDYQLLFELGEGGMGKVYIARHVQQADQVAVKLAKPEVLESSGGAATFLREIRTASALSHPNIVRVYTSGTTPDGRLYLVMPLLEGGPLDDPANRGQFGDPRRALALMIDVARAVQFAHERLILHCDLKPANILLDAAGAPHVTDFGLARVSGKPGSSYRGAIQGGTRGWMSPEQAARCELTAASDVFSLGLLLKWALGDEIPELLSTPVALPSGAPAAPLVAQPVPRAAKRPARGIEWELRTIADKAAQPAPERRYQSAAELVGELERVRDRLPIEAERHVPWRRARKWIRRHPWAAAGAVQAVLLLIYLALTPLSVLREVRSVIREKNAFAAATQAGSVMNELRSYAARIEALAATPEIVALIGHQQIYVPPPALLERMSGFDTLAVFALDGTLKARCPRPAMEYVNMNFAYRDYFRVLKRVAEGAQEEPTFAYVSRVFYSRTDGHLYIGFAAPLRNAAGRPMGIVLGTAAARSTFGAVQMNCTGGGDCMTALLGARDRNDPAQPLPDAVNVVAQPGLADGEDRVLDRATGVRICAAVGCAPRLNRQFSLPVRVEPYVDDDYRDPVSGARSIAAAAPVGGTGLVVLVATPVSGAEALAQRMINRMKAYVWIPLVPGLLLLLVFAVTLIVVRRRAGVPLSAPAARAAAASAAFRTSPVSVPPGDGVDGVAHVGVAASPQAGLATSGSANTLKSVS